MLQAGRLKWRNALDLLCDRREPLKPKGKFFETLIRPALLYGFEFWTINYEHEQIM